MKTDINKNKIEKILDKSVAYNIIQNHNGINCITDGYCMWLDHEKLFDGMDRYFYLNEERKENINNLKVVTDYLINDYLQSYDYIEADEFEKCVLVNDLPRRKQNKKEKTKSVLLKNCDFYKLINQKYYDTFDKGCNFLIAPQYIMVFVTNKEGLLIGIIMPLNDNNSHIEK